MFICVPAYFLLPSFMLMIIYHLKPISFIFLIVLNLNATLVYFFLISTAFCKPLTTVERTSTGIENPCHLKPNTSIGVVAHVEDNVTDHSIIIRIISDHSSGLIIKSLGLAGTAADFKQCVSIAMNKTDSS